LLLCKTKRFLFSYKTIRVFIFMKRYKTVYNTCPYCNQRIIFKIGLSDIDQSHYPAPVYLHHKDDNCDKISTFYVDSLLRVSYKELGKKKSITGREIKILETI